MNKNEFFLSRFFRDQLSMDPFSLVRDGKCQELKTLIESNPKVLKSKTLRGSYYVNLLWEAMNLGNHAIADMLLSAGLKPEGYVNRPDVNSIAYMGDLEMFELYTVKHGISFLEGEKPYVHEEKFMSVGCGCGKVCEHKEFAFKQSVSNPILCDAIAGGNKFIIRKVFPHVDIEAENEKGRTALHVACAKIDLELVQFLLQHHADPNHVTVAPKPWANMAHYALTPTNYTIMLCKDVGKYEPEKAEQYFDIIKCLLSAGGKVELELSTILDMELELFALLYEHLPDFIKQTMKLRYLLYSNDISAIKLLLNRDMYNTFFAEECYSPYTSVMPLHPTSIIIKKSHDEILSHLLEFFKDQLIGQDYEVLIVKAAKYNNEYILKYVYNLTLLAPRNHLKTAIHFAIKNKNARLVKFLIEKGNKIDSDIFSFAWGVGNHEIVKLLISLSPGYDVNRNETLLYQYYARKTKEDEFLRSVKLILDVGYNINNRGHNKKHIVEELVESWRFTYVECRLLCLLLTYPNLNYDTEQVSKKLQEMVDKYDAKSYVKCHAAKSDCPADDMEIEHIESLNMYAPIFKAIMSSRVECCICFHNNEKFPMPCGHSVLCTMCAPHVSTCPQCTKDIRPENS